jgi:NADPH:quinone reductase-like Zn-dependent oxidoreductase
MGIVPSTAGLGIEAAGIVVRTGSNVNSLHAGDRVFMMAGGCFSSKLIVPAHICAKIPDSLSFEQAATMPCVHSTALYSLVDIGRLEKGQVSAGLL